MLPWRNGRRGSLKNCCPKGRVGSSPTGSTTQILTMMDRDLLSECITEILREMRWRGLYRSLRQKYPNIPEYVFHDVYRVGMDEIPLYKAFNRLQWRLQVITVNLGDFSPDTRRRIMERQFGSSNPYQVPRDEERMATQKKLATGTGENEPIIVVKRVDGYELHEGWHRTMNLLKVGMNDGPPETWNKVRIKAWVGSGQPRVVTKR